MSIIIVTTIIIIIIASFTIHAVNKNVLWDFEDQLLPSSHSNCLTGSSFLFLCAGGCFLLLGTSLVFGNSARDSSLWP